MASSEEERAVTEAIHKLSPAEAEMFLHKLERAIVKRRLQLWGYMLSLIVWAVAMLCALVYYGSADPHTFRSWIFAFPFLGIGLVLYVFGWLADRAGKAAPKKPFRAAPETAARELAGDQAGKPTSKQAGKRKR